jgi:hypothetical protein
MKTIGFVNFNPKGLKPLTDELEKKHKLPVVDVKAPNMPKREDGFQVKTATFTFESGQKMVLKIKANGTIFQVRLNGKVIPVKNSEDLHVPQNFKKAVKEMANFVKKNEPAYTKQKAKRLNKAVGPKPKRVSASVAKQLSFKKSLLEDLKAEATELGQELTEQKGVADTKTSNLEALKAELKTEQDRNEALQTEYNQLLEAA